MYRQSLEEMFRHGIRKNEIFKHKVSLTGDLNYNKVCCYLIDCYQDKKKLKCLMQ